jgi:hypothetical protein
MCYNKKIFKRSFCYRKKYWYKNLLNIPYYFKQIFYLIKHGYDNSAVWNINSWFVDNMKNILMEYEKNRVGTPILVENFPWGDAKNEEEEKIIKKNEEEWKRIINRMIELLNLMDESNDAYDDLEYKDWKKDQEKMKAAKNEFFELFSKYFYDLWD